MKPIRPTWRRADIAPLPVRYAELLRLREYVRRLEGLRQDTALSREPRAIVRQHEFENGRRFRSTFRPLAAETDLPVSGLHGRCAAYCQPEGGDRAWEASA